MIVPDANSLQVATLPAVNFRLKLSDEEAKSVWSSAYEVKQHPCEGCGRRCRNNQEGYLSHKIPRRMAKNIPQSTWDTFMCLNCWDKFHVTPWAFKFASSKSSSAPSAANGV